MKLFNKDFNAILLDHKCNELEKLCKQGKIGYRKTICDCSLCERDYYIKIGGTWTPIVYCLFCGKHIKEYRMVRLNETVR